MSVEVSLAYLVPNAKHLVDNATTTTTARVLPSAYNDLWLRTIVSAGTNHQKHHESNFGRRLELP